MISEIYIPEELTALEHDAEEEVLGVSVSVGLSSYSLDHVVSALDPAGIYREAGIVKDVIR